MSFLAGAIIPLGGGGTNTPPLQRDVELDAYSPLILFCGENAPGSLSVCVVQLVVMPVICESKDQHEGLVNTYNTSTLAHYELIFTSDFSSTGRLLAVMISVLFCWHTQHRSDIGRDTTTCGVSCCQSS